MNNQTTGTFSPEFINLRPDAINPGISKCEIKVFYLGKNRNGSFIDKETAVKMADTLPGTPIVGVFREEKGDFGDHGEVVRVEEGEIKFLCETVPYGFVSPDAKVWFQDFTELNDEGLEVSRTYMMTTGYLWTGQYPEIANCVEEGRGQSMEIDVNDGYYKNNSAGLPYIYIIADAEFSKLCILGEDVEPCFEGASVTATNMSFSKEKFTKTLFSMMDELKATLIAEKGVKENMTKQSKEILANQEEEVALFKKAEEEEKTEDSKTAEEEKVEESEEDTAEADAEEEEKKDSQKHELKEEEKETAQEENEEEETKKKCSLESELAEINAKYAALLEEVESLRAFKLERENAEKDALIKKYFMISDEDKADIVAHKHEFSLQDIEEKLALLYVRKNVDFEGSMDDSEEESPLLAFSLDNTVNVPAEENADLVDALRKAQNTL